MDGLDFRVCKVTITALTTAVFNNANFEMQTFTFILYRYIFRFSRHSACYTSPEIVSE